MKKIILDIKNRFNNISLGKKVFMISVVLVLCMYIIINTVIYYQIKKTIEQYNIDYLQKEVNLIKEQISIFDNTIRYCADSLMGIFLDMISITKADNDICDKFTKITNGSVATIFEKKGDDFLRIATSLRKEDGTRALGTTLDRNHPAYSLLLQGDTYVGKAKLFGRDYMTKYIPIKDKSNNIIGSYFIGFDISENINNLKNYIRSIKVGKIGYIYVLDTSEKNKGTLIVHPALENKNIIDAKDANNKYFIKEMIDKKTGIIQYDWKNPGEYYAKEKIAVYSVYEKWNWLIASGSYTEDIIGQIDYIQKVMIITCISGSLIISILLYIIIVKSLSPIKNIITKLNEVSSGDFKVIGFGKGYRNRKDEIGFIAQSVIKVEEFMQYLVKEIKKSVEDINNTIQLLIKNIEEFKNNIDTQTSQSHQIATASEEMSQTITDIAKNASIASDIATQAENISQEGKKLSEDAMVKVQSANKSTNELRDVINKLNAKIEEISGIVLVIKDIADQTNLLALNAAIEAARAGELGKGFAVVADEVRKLAEKTIRSTNEIADKVKSVQNESKESIKNMDITYQQVLNVIDTLDTMKNSLGNIYIYSQKVKDSITQIAASTEEQSSASDEVAKLAEDSSNISNNIKQKTIIISDKINDLYNVINKLQNAIKDIKI